MLFRSTLLGIGILAWGVACQAETIEFSVLFGFGDAEPATWDGEIRASGARILKLEGWRLQRPDEIDGNRWRLATRRVRLTRGRQRRGRLPPVLENGILVTAETQDSSAQFRVRTDQGDFQITLDELAWGQTVSKLGGRVKIERVPAATRLTDSIEEEDFPALAEGNGKIYLAYIEFTHGDRSQAWPRLLRKKPASFAPLARPVGGDRIFLVEYDPAARRWSAPDAVTEPGQDLYRAAVAVDGEGRVWVVWSARKDGNFDIYARFKKAGRWSKTMRLTEAPGPDLQPAAVTDSLGRVWISWQGDRNGFDILLKVQQGENFGPETTVSTSPANDWAPQIAAGPDGEVAVAWDTYDKGDYDVYVRRMRWRGGIKLNDPQPVAASARFEARPSVAIDPAGRVWVAYEESYPRWGKDFGAYETTGSGLYQGQHVRVKILENGSYFTTRDNIAQALRKRPATHPYNKAANRRIPERYTPQPAPQLARNRRPGSTPYERFYPSKSHPRLAVAPDGTVFLAYRSAAGRVWGPLGTSWFENLVWFDGERWHGPVFVPFSDGILDRRPAMLARSGPALLMASASDHRFAWSGRPRRQRDIFHYDVFVHEMRLNVKAGRTLLAELPPEGPARGSGEVSAEQRQVALIRDYRVTLSSGGKKETLRLLRGEFHRHTEISGDGGNDGALIDAWRYLLDAAYMDWAGCCDHDNGGGREYTWWLTQKATDAFLLPGRFTPMFSYERSVRYPEGHRNVVFARRGVRPLPRLPKTADDSPPEPAPDTQMLYAYLRYFDGVAAVHTSATNMGTDWRDNDPEVEPVVEIYQGDRQNYEMPGAPRANSAKDSIGGWRPKGFVNLALEKGYRLAFQASSDHISTHMSYCNVWVTEPTREAILEAFKKRRVYGATDNILADVRCNGHFMGEEFAQKGAPTLEIKLIGQDRFAKVHIIKDGRYVYTAEPNTREVTLTWKDADARPGTSYYYVRGEQADGEIVWVSPMWITIR